MKYSLSKLGRRAGRKKGTVAYLPIIQPRLSSERGYLKALRSMLRQIARETQESIIPAYQAELEHKRSQKAFTGDVDRSWFQHLVNTIGQLNATVERTVQTIIKLEAERHTKQFVETVRRSIGIDVSALINQEDLADYLQTAVARNGSLITSLSDDLRKRIEEKVYQNSIAGNSVATLKKQLTEQFGVVESRAKLIARDQTAKLNSDLNRIRQEQAGVEAYEWMTSRDERVRSRHRKLSGNIYKWGQGTGAEGGLPPGQPVNCRCIARGVVSFGEEAKPKPSSKSEASFKAPKNATEARDFVIKSGIAAEANFKGMAVSKMGGALEAAKEVTDRFGLSPLEFFGPSSRHPSLKLRTPRNANAAIFPYIRNGKKTGTFHTPTKFGNLKEYEEQHRMQVLRSEAYTLRRDNKLKEKQGLSPDLQKRLTKMKKGEYSWTISGLQEATEKARVTTYHEYGHVVHLTTEEMGDEINRFLSSERPIQNGWSALLSEYASANNHEFVAEAFSAYMLGEDFHYRIHPELLEIFKRHDRNIDN